MDAIATKTSYRPKIDPQTFVAMKDGKILVLNPAIPDWIVVNENAGYVLGLCDGSRNVEAVFSEAQNAGIPTGINIINDLIDQCRQIGVLSDGYDNVCSNMQEHSLSEETEVKPTQLHSVHLKLTNKCNLACVYCYAESASCTSSPTLSLDELIQISKDTKKLSPHVDFTLSGGEPLMHPNALEFAEYLRKEGNRVGLLTNGALINRNNVKKISELFTLIKVSLDGTTDEINSLTRGKNTSKAAVKAFDLLMAENANVLMNMTVTKTNLHDISNMVKRYGDRLNFQPLFKAGLAKDEDENAITGDEYYEALASVDGVNPLAKIGEIITSYKGTGISKCPLADGDVSISETGDVYPCQMLYEPEFKGGNIKESSLIDIYNGSEAFKPLRRLQVENLKGCSTCAVRRICGGSCRARAYLETGDIGVSGQFCDYERRAIINGILDNTEFT
jgi:radical SAM protein with 4Fe4S-binding SPASM domain